MIQRWETLAFLHWDYPVEVVQSLLPRGLRVEPWHGRAWIGLVPFHMQVRSPIAPTFLSRSFPETNVRTYVTGPNGESGVFFFSLDAADRAAVRAARMFYGLPYFFAEMEVNRDTDAGSLCYRAERIFPPGSDAAYRVEVVPADPLAPAEIGEFENYLTARFRLWNVHLGLVMTTPVEHPPWPLQKARLLRLDQSLLQAAGLPQPSGDALVHYSGGVDVRIGVPDLVCRVRDTRESSSLQRTDAAIPRRSKTWSRLERFAGTAIKRPSRTNL